MTRVQVLLEKDQDRRLKALAAKRRQSKGQLVRRAIDLLLQSESASDEPLLSLIGQAGRSRRSDISNRHDQVLADTERARNRPGMTARRVFATRAPGLPPGRGR